MAKRFNFDEAITTDIKGAASDSYIDNIKMIKVTDIETNSENFYSLPDIEELAEDIERQGLIHSLAVTKTSTGTYKLISGHRRLSAIKLLSEKGKWNNGTVPCYVITAKKSDTEMNLDLIMLNHTQRKYSDADIFKEHEELKKIFTQLEADGVEIKGRLREKIAKAMHVSSAQIGKIENIKNNAIDSVKAAVESGELSISTANEIAKHNTTKQREIISSPAKKIKTADVRNINDKPKAKNSKCDEPNSGSTSDEAIEIYLTTDEIMFMKKNLDRLGFSYLLSVSSDNDKQIIENIISKIKGEKTNYMIVTKIQLELLKMNEIELAAFPKDDGKYNVAFMPDTKELITKILYPADESKQETEYERNNRLNKEIKRLAAVNGEKPKYRMVAPELLDNIKQSGIQFAYFKKGDKYNIVFLRKNETEIDQLLKQLRKEK